MLNPDSGFLKHIKGILFIMIVLFTDNALDAAVNQHLRANHAGRGRDVDGGTLEAHAMHGGLYDDVLLRVQAPANLVPFPGRDALLFAQAAGELAVFDAGGRAVVAGSEDVPVKDGHGTNLATETGGTGGSVAGHREEVVVPGRRFFCGLGTITR